jgi:hypothetical protein
MMLQALIFGTLFFGAGFGLMIYSTQGACKKQDLVAAAIDSAIMSAIMVATYLLLPYFGILVEPVRRLLIGFHLAENTADWISQAYILMLMSWIVTMWAGLRIQQRVCKPSKKERDKFKADLLAKLHKLQPKNAPPLRP